MPPEALKISLLDSRSLAINGILSIMFAIGSWLLAYAGAKRKQVENDLQLFQKLIDQSNDAVFVIDPETSHFLNVNQKACNNLGYTRKELLSMKVIDIEAMIPDGFSWNKHIRELREKEDMVLEGVHKRKDGTTFPTEISVKLVTQEEKVYMVSAARDITERKIAEEALVKAHEGLETKVQERTVDLVKANRELHNLSGHLQSVRENERAMIARDIHDELGQLLTVMKLGISNLASELDKESQTNMADDLSRQVRNCIKTVQKIYTSLRPSILDDLGIIAAIQWLADEFENNTGIKCLLDVDFDFVSLDNECSIAAFRVFQETLNNVTRHANATEVKAKITNENNKLTLTINDNGRGITIQEINSFKSFGLIGIKERTQQVGGKFSINGVDNKGTTITLTIPVDEKRESL